MCTIGSKAEGSDQKPKQFLCNNVYDWIKSRRECQRKAKQFLCHNECLRPSRTGTHPFCSESFVRVEKNKLEGDGHDMAPPIDT
jgi:hypothetical protein